MSSLNVPLKTSSSERTHPTLLVLAAGMGSRFGGLKQLEGLGPNGETLLEYALYDALEAGFGRVVFVIRNSFREVFFERIVERFRHYIEIDYVLQEMHKVPAGVQLPEEREKPWGTGHAVLIAKRLIEGPFAVINADDFYGRGSFEAAAQFLRTVPVQRWPVPFGLVAFQLAKTLSPHGAVSRGICAVDEKGLLTSVIEEPRIRLGEQGPEAIEGEDRVRPLDPETPTSLNFFVFTPDIFGFLEDQFVQFLAERGNEIGSEFFLPTAVSTMIRRGQATVRVLRSPEAWVGVTYPEDREATQIRLRRLHDSGVYPSRLWR